MATRRKAISKKVRFDVFKRDSFKCQYCGKSAPDVVLHIDHIQPVSKGGMNDIHNLLTACAECNGGKGGTELHDDSAIQKQRQQLQELNERREQLEMMLKWREGLTEICEAGASAVAEAWAEALENAFYLNESGQREAKALVKKFGVSEVLESIDIATDRHLSYENGRPTAESANHAWRMVAKICQFRSKPKHVQELHYVRGIMRNRFHYINESVALRTLETAYEAGVDIETLKAIAKSERSWTNWVAAMDDVMQELQ